MSSEPKRAGQSGTDAPKTGTEKSQTIQHDTVVPAAPMASGAASMQPPAHPASGGASAPSPSAMATPKGAPPKAASTGMSAPSGTDQLKDAAADAGEAVKRGAETAKATVQDAASDAAATARRAAQDLKAQASSAASGATDAIREGAGNVLSSVTEQAAGVAEDLKARGADAAGGVVQALRSASEELDRASPMAAGYVRGAADAADRAIRDLRERPVQDLAGDLIAFARRQPVAFFAGAVILGFAASRFLKTSAPEGAGYPAGPDARREVRPDAFV